MFAVFRKDSAGYFPRGPAAKPMTLQEAETEVLALKKRWPHQAFVIMGEVGEATRSESITVSIESPLQPEPAQVRRLSPQKT